jgi:hypothetical protein
MAQGDFSGFDPDLGIGSTTVACRTGRENDRFWIEIELVGEDGSPCPGEKYRVKCPDGSVKTGSLDESGFTRIALDRPGTCGISFPDFDKDAWEPAR